MKSYLSFAWKELKAQRIPSILILIALMLSTIMTTVTCQSIGILQSMRISQAARLNGNRYATFYQLTKEQAKLLHRDSRLYDVGDILNIGHTPLADSSLTLYLREYHENALAMFPDTGKVKEGHLPEKENEIALPEDALQYLGIKPSVGDTISLDLSAGLMDGSIPSYGYTADFTLTAILENNYLGYSTGIVEGIVGKGTAENLLPGEYLFYATQFKTNSKKDFQKIVYDLAAALRLDERYIQYNWILLDALSISYDGEGSSKTGVGFPFLAFACVLVGALVLLAAGLVIYNILKISITKRIGEYGTLRAIGGERGQIYCLVSLQLFILCVIGMPLGLLLGILSVKSILIAATGVLNPELFMVNSSDELSNAIHSAGAANLPFLCISLGITLLFALAAAFPGARFASHVSPTVAMTGQRVKIKRKVKKTKPIRNFEAYYARLNLKRGRGRTVITILSLVMSITVFVALQSFTGLLDASEDMKELHTGDYAVTNETTGISKEAVNVLKGQDFVESLATTKLMVCDSMEEIPFDMDFSIQSHETLQVAGLDENSLFSLMPNLTRQGQEDLILGRACLVKNPMEFSIGDTDVAFTNIKAGDTITLNGIAMNVIGIVDFPVIINNGGFANGVQVIVADNIFNSITGNDNYSEIYPVLKEDTDAEVFEDWMKDWCEKNPGTHWISYRLSDAQMAESFEQIRMLCWVLITFIGIIGILNIINTVYSNIHTRISEIGMQRAIGMSTESLYKTFLWEGMYYGIYASLIGGLLGYICCVLIGAAERDGLELVAIPFLTISEAAVVSIAACLLATAVPLGTIVKMNIVEMIEGVE